MSLKERILEDMKTAMRSQDKDRLSAIRLIIASVKQREIDEQITLTDEQILATLNKMIKQRRDAIAQFEAGNRKDLAEKENAEIKVIQSYLPAQMSETELDQTIRAVIQETGATSARDMGKVMNALKAKIQGKADMSVASAKVREQLAG